MKPRSQLISTASGSPVSRARFAAALVLILFAGGMLRLSFPVADPPTRPSVGIVWHDEGAWVHNARNRVLFGTWQTDEWNPMYVTPVLTGLEYFSFRVLGVGLRQARLVPQLLGILSVLLMGLAVARVGNRLSGLLAAALLATNFVYVMYNRAATIEGTMLAFLVIAWYGYARAGDSPRWGLLAGAAAVAAYFTKASAVFFIVAIGADSLVAIARRRRCLSDPEARAALYALAGLAVAGCLAMLLFVLPNWEAYRFYNWQLSVTRKPTYTVAALVQRASWLPIVSDFFTHMWLVLVVALASALARLGAWRKLVPAERLLLWWVGLGILELVLRDVQERYLTLLIPPMIALAALTLGSDRRLVSEDAAKKTTGLSALLAAPAVFYVLYMISGTVVRLLFVFRISPAVRTSALLALLLGLAFYATRKKTVIWLSSQRWSPAAAVLVVALAVGGDVAQFTQWASRRTTKNYEAMLLIGKDLPPGTLVHGKLANGLDLENRIRPVFVGRGFGNYADRLRRDDVRYVVTYISPSIGYEGGRDGSGRAVIQDVLDRYPNRRTLRVFDLAESPADQDAGVLIDKNGPAIVEAAGSRTPAAAVVR